MTDTEQRARCAVVTGASQGIGRAIAQRLAGDGWTVWAVARRAEVLAELAGAEAGVVPAACDLTDPDAVAALVAALGENGTQIAALVHCAGLHAPGSVADTEPAELSAQFAVNVEAPYRLTRSLLPHLAAGASIVFLNSTQGLRASAGVTPFAASMHAVRALADSLRDEVNERGIKVTSVYPGRVSTPRQEKIYARQGRDYQPGLLLQPADVATMVATILDLPPTAEVTDISIRPAIKSY